MPSISFKTTMLVALASALGSASSAPAQAPSSTIYSPSITPALSIESATLPSQYLSYQYTIDHAALASLSKVAATMTGPMAIALASEYSALESTFAREWSEMTSAVHVTGWAWTSPGALKHGPTTTATTRHGRHGGTQKATTSGSASASPSSSASASSSGSGGNGAAILKNDSSFLRSAPLAIAAGVVGTIFVVVGLL